MTRQPIITNPMMKYPFLAGSKLVFVFLFPPMFLDMPPDFYYDIYLPFIVPLLYWREILGLVLPLIGKGYLVDNSSPNIRILPYHYYSTSDNNLWYDDINHNHDHSHRH